MPVFQYAARILSLPEFDKRYKLFTSPICLAIAFYFSEKKCGTVQSIKKMHLLTQKIEILAVGPKEVNQVNANIKIKDYEDGLEYYLAYNNKCGAIITEDRYDFYFSEIPIFSSKDFILNELYS